MTDLESKVRSWLDEHGYPLEMEIARAMQLAEFGVVQAEYVEDADTGTARETDIIAYEESRGENCRVLSAVTVECKSQKSKPWVLFTNPGSYPPYLSVSRRATSERGRNVLRAISNRSEVQTLLPFALPKRTAYGVTIALRDNQDLAYQALNSVAKAALGIVARLSAVESGNLIPIAFPIVVIEAPLFESYLDESGTLMVEPVETGFLIWRNPVIDKHSLIQIYRKDRFVMELPQYRDHLLEFCAYAAEEFDRQEQSDG